MSFSPGESHDFATGSYRRVTLDIDHENVNNRIWKRMVAKMPKEGWYSYADCFRTSSSVSGISPAPATQEKKPW